MYVFSVLVLWTHVCKQGLSARLEDQRLLLVVCHEVKHIGEGLQWERPRKNKSLVLGFTHFCGI